jgi:hypothetical protein
MTIGLKHGVTIDTGSGESTIVTWQTARSLPRRRFMIERDPLGVGATEDKPLTTTRTTSYVPQSLTDVAS